MTKHKLDQLFKDKLEHTTVEPSSMAFEKFQNQISGKKKPLAWFYIAASVSLILGVSTWFWTKNYEESVDIASTEANIVDPIYDLDGWAEDVQQSNSALTLEQVPNASVPGSAAPLVADTKEVPSTVNVTIAQKETSPALEIIAVAQSKDLRAKEVIDKEESEALKEIPELDLESDHPVLVVATNEIEEIREPTVKPLPKVKITFISGKKKRKSLIAEANMSADSTNVKDGTFNKILNSARSLANGSLIADLRDVKENFFNKNDD